MVEESSKPPQKVTLTLPADTVEYLKIEADRTGLSMADVLRQSLRRVRKLQQLKAGEDATAAQVKALDIWD